MSKLELKHAVENFFKIENKVFQHEIIEVWELYAGFIAAQISSGSGLQIAKKKLFTLTKVQLISLRLLC